MKSVQATAANKIKSAGKPVVIAKNKSTTIKLVKKNSAPAAVTGAAVQGTYDSFLHGAWPTDFGFGVVALDDDHLFEMIEHYECYGVASSVKEAFKRSVGYSKTSELADFNFDSLSGLQHLVA